jgi:hypothetical protein
MWSNEEVRSFKRFFSIADICISITQNLISLFRAVATSLDDPEFPVRVQAALALTEMVQVHDSSTFLSFLQV